MGQTVAMRFIGKKVVRRGQTVSASEKLVSVVRLTKNDDVAGKLAVPLPH